MNRTKLTGFLLLLCGAQLGFASDQQERLDELNTYWTEVSHSVKEGDFEGYQASSHSSAVLVSGTSQTSYPFSAALAKWKQGFADTKSGKIKASVAFRFSQRIGDDSSAHETGMFLYSTTNADGESTIAYIHFEALLIKEDRWLIMMEYQKSKGTKEEWDKLKSSSN